MISHSADPKPYNCDKCIQRFSNKSHLIRHVKFIHNNQQIYNCEICSLSFNKKNKLTKHVFKHGAKKNYKCYFPFCEKSFFTEGRLKVHINNHKNEFTTEIKETEYEKKFYKCPFEDCLKTYSSSYNLSVHITTFHNKISEFICVCSKAFKHKCSLEKHKLKHGPEITQENIIQA